MKAILILTVLILFLKYYTNFHCDSFEKPLISKKFSVCKSTTFFQQDLQLQFCGRPSFLYDWWLATEPIRSIPEIYFSNYKQKKNLPCTIKNPSNRTSFSHCILEKKSSVNQTNRVFQSRYYGLSSINGLYLHAKFTTLVVFYKLIQHRVSIIKLAVCC